MQSSHEPALGAGRKTRPHRASKPAWIAVMASLGLFACAGPSPKVQVAAADASQPATADPSPPISANEQAATAQSRPDSTPATASASTATPAGATDTSAAAAAPEPRATADVAPPAPAPVVTGQPEQGSTPAPASGNAASPVGVTDTSASSQPPEPQVTADAAPAAPPPAAIDTPQTATAPPPALSPTPGSSSDVGQPGSGLATGRPYVVIRFAESSVDYEKTLSEAVKRAVARKPNLAFDLVAVTPRASTAEELADLTTQAHAQAAAVMKSLVGLGIPSERVSIMTWTGQPIDVNEIRLYIR